MLNRFFKLLYVFGLIAIVLSLPIFILSQIHFDRIVETSYKAKCTSNNQYVVLQGSSVAYIFDNLALNNSEFKTGEDLNFYCKYYDEIQPHIATYIKSKSRAEQISANLAFVDFEKSVGRANIYPYPKLYELEIVDKEIHYYAIYIPLINWLLAAGASFLILQILRISYVYIVFGKIIWHPFKSLKK